MNFDQIKTKRLLEHLGDKLPKKNADNQSGGTYGESKEGPVLSEAPAVPSFVKHCVTAITQKPAVLAKIQKKKDGSPFGVCTAAYQRNKQSLSAKHGTGEHHSAKDYKIALSKLREGTAAQRATRPSRDRIVFEARDKDRLIRHDEITFRPE